MEALPPPAPLVLAENAAANWKKFRQRIELYFVATGKERTSTEKAAIFLHVAGQEAIDVFNTFRLTSAQAEDYDVLVRKFEEYCAPQQNETFERYVFRMRLQNEGEPFEQFLRDVQLKAQSCNFRDLKYSMVRDQLVCRTRDKKLRNRLLREKDLTLEKAIDFCKAAEAATSQARVWEQAETAQVIGTVEGKLDGPARSKTLRRCNFCGSCHPPRKCPAWGKRCVVCRKLNYFAACCRAKRSVQEVECPEEKSEDDFETLDVHIAGVASSNDWIVPVKVDTDTVHMKVDTGAQANLLPLSLYRRLKRKPPLRPSQTVLSGYGGNAIQHVGTTVLPLQVGDKCEQLVFYVVKKGKQALLGLEACEKFGFIARVRSVSQEEGMDKQRIIEEFPALFRGLGCTRRQYRISLKDDARPIALPSRRVPRALKEPLRQELDRMEAEGIIIRMQDPTDWVSPLVIVTKKNGRLRVCMDPRRVNEGIRREHYELPQREDIEAELAGAKYFSKLDANRGFYQIPLDDYTSCICTFSTPFSRYRFLRLPFGLSSAPEVFQKAMSDALDNLPGVRVYIDDILVWGATREEHDARLKAALRAIETAGSTLNPEKCVVAADKIKFLGDVLSKEGIRPDPDLFDFTLQFVSGKQLLLADALSRLRIPPDSTRAEEYEDVAMHAVNILSTLVSDAMVKRLQAATAEDEDLRSSPLEDGSSPAQLLMGRQLRGRLPDFSTPQATEVKKQTQRHRPRPELPPLRTGDTHDPPFRRSRLD
nr:uncharacterized protein K02A2.6-like [Dermacentor andersoni]